MTDNATNQLSKFRTKYWVGITNDRGVYSSNKEIELKNSMLKSSLCCYSNAYIPIKGATSAANTAAADTDANNTNIKVIFTNCAPFEKCTAEINSTQ